jgi:hypothetical protein
VEARICELRSKGRRDTDPQLAQVRIIRAEALQKPAVQGRSILCVWEDAAMAYEAGTQTRTTSLYYQFYQQAFEMADTTSIFWQPFLKAAGRTQLEVASLQARQAQAFIHWAHRMMQPASPVDVYSAHAQFWTTIAGQYIETVPRVAAAVEKAAEAVVPTVLPLPSKQNRDGLILLDRQETSEPLERKVA